MPATRSVKTLIVYDSVYGNTEKIAKAIGDSIAGSKVLRAYEADYSALKEFDLIIVGSPTHGGRLTEAVKDFLGKIPANSLGNTCVASFDTRASAEGVFMKALINFFGYAAGRIADSLKSKGGLLVAAPEGFILTYSHL
ncbi:flavodoxin family protein [Candidatus Micrarchaeota archaeon]|nr:flavodoxin family protein [Candidatus Micrarchaeota archaeon]